jgi:hypothetical protein
MLLKAIGQPLATAKRVYKRNWEMPKGYWKASGQFLKGTGNPTAANMRKNIIARRLLAKSYQFLFISHEGIISCLY